MHAPATMFTFMAHPEHRGDTSRTGKDRMPDRGPPGVVGGDLPGQQRVRRSDQVDGDPARERPSEGGARGGRASVSHTRGTYLSAKYKRIAARPPRRPRRGLLHPPQPRTPQEARPAPATTSPSTPPPQQPKDGRRHKGNLRAGRAQLLQRPCCAGRMSPPPGGARRTRMRESATRSRWQTRSHVATVQLSPHRRSRLASSGGYGS